MGYEVSYDEANDVVVMQAQGDFTADEAGRMANEIGLLLQGKPHRQMLAVLNGGANLAGTEARRLVGEQMRVLGITHLAVANANPATRIIAKILVNLAGGSVKASFFPSAEEALNWLKAERGGA
jgi:hypothetical protein